MVDSEKKPSRQTKWRIRRRNQNGRRLGLQPKIKLGLKNNMADLGLLFMS